MSRLTGKDPELDCAIVHCMRAVLCSVTGLIVHHYLPTSGSQCYIISVQIDKRLQPYSYGCTAVHVLIQMYCMMYDRTRAIHQLRGGKF
eukprot:COSAG01_NODE_5383_length_4295_cov_2.871306_1_plen_89_part_00